MATWPLFADQFYKEKLVTQVLKIGISVGVQEMRNMGVSAKREAIEKALKEIMVGDGAKEMKKREKGLGLGLRARRAVEEGVETDLQSGAQYKYGLLWIILVASCAALIIQSLAANLGIVVGKHLAEHYRNVTYPKVPNFVLWVLAEISIVACGMPEDTIPSSTQLLVLSRKIPRPVQGIKILYDRKWLALMVAFLINVSIISVSGAVLQGLGRKQS